MDLTPAARHLRTAIGQAVRAGRDQVGWSQEELSAAAGVSAGMVAMVERGLANVTVDMAGRLFATLGLTIDLRYQLPFAAPRQRDAVHAKCVAYVQRRLEAAGWLVRREVEIVHGRSRGWIDLLAFNPATGVLLVIEVKTEIHDLGRIERTLSWYGREAWVAAQRLGWRPRSVGTWLLLLASEANEERLRENRDPLGQTFPGRGMSMLDEGTAAGLALIDPRSRRREWLIRARIDGRRSPAPYASYADFLRRDEGGG